MISRIALKSARSATGKGMRSFATIDPNCVVNSHNEFDPLEEVIVGRVDGATIPEWHVSGKAVWPTKHWDMYKNKSGQPFPAELLKKGKQVHTIISGIYI